MNEPNNVESELQSHGMECAHDCSVNGGRRDFLVRAAVGAGGLVLGLSGATKAFAADPTPDAPAPAAPAPADAAPAVDAATGDELVLKVDGDSPLKEVGGFETLDTKMGKVVVARTGEATFAACSAICPHKGGPIKYDAASQQFFCPWHNSRFDLNGKVVHPPARQPLRSFAPHNAVVVSLKPQN